MPETQESIFNWINETFPGTNPDSPRKSLRLLEECVELCIASGATPHEVELATERALNCAAEWQPKNGRDPQPDKIAAEAADVLIVLYGLAGMRGIDLHTEVDRKMVRNRSRTWHALGDGTGYHIKES